MLSDGGLNTLTAPPPLPENESEKDDGDRIRSRSALRKGIWLIAVPATLLVILAQTSIGPQYFDSLGKMIFWTGCVFVPLFGLNLDIFRQNAGIILWLALLAIHIACVCLLFRNLSNMTFIPLAGISIIEMMVFEFVVIAFRRSTNQE